MLENIAYCADSIHLSSSSVFSVTPKESFPPVTRQLAMCGKCGDCVGVQSQQKQRPPLQQSKLLPADGGGGG